MYVYLFYSFLEILFICYKYYNIFVNICYFYLVFGMYKFMINFFIIMSKSDSGVYLNMFSGRLFYYS